MSAPAPQKTVAILQSNYIPWKGYFDLIAQCHEFVLYDDVQYTRRDWRNRNKIKTPNGLHWLTIPVQVKGKYFQAIKDTKVSEAGWARTHWKTLCGAYGRAPFFRHCQEVFESFYNGAASEFLSDVNRDLIERVCGLLGIRTRITQSMDYKVEVEDRSERLLEICRRAGATEYLSGPAARDYLDERMFREAGVRVRWMDYSGYPEYPQLYPPFEHGVSVVDLLFSTGASAPGYLERRRQAA
jgi:hypothetical protein